MLWVAQFCEGYKGKQQGEIQSGVSQNFHLVFLRINPDTWKRWPQYSKRIIYEVFLVGDSLAS